MEGREGKLEARILARGMDLPRSGGVREEYFDEDMSRAVGVLQVSQTQYIGVFGGEDMSITILCDPRPGICSTSYSSN